MYLDGQGPVTYLVLTQAARQRNPQPNEPLWRYPLTVGTPHDCKIDRSIQFRLLLVLSA